MARAVFPALRLFFLSVLLLCWAGANRSAEAGSLRWGGMHICNVPPIEVGVEAHTIEMWVRPAEPLPSASTPAVLFDWNGRVQVRNSIGSLEYAVDLGGAAPLRIITSPLPPIEWHHVAVIFDGKGKNLRILVDGKIVISRPVQGQIPGPAAAPASLGAPRGAAPGGLQYIGRLDDVRIWSVARSEEEIFEEMLDRADRGGAGLVAYWDFDEESGQTARDRIGGHNAVLGDSGAADARDPVWTPQTSPVRKPHPALKFHFDPPGPISTIAGKSFDVACLVTLADQAPRGVTAWTVAVRHNRRHLVLEDVTLQATAADGRRDDGFAGLEMVDDGTSAGFVSRVILSADGGATLPPLGAFALARARYHGVLNFVPETRAKIFFDDRLSASGTVSAANSLSAQGIQYLPDEGRLLVELKAPDFFLEFDPYTAAVLPGREIEADCILTTANNPASSGVNAWSIAVNHDSSVLDLVNVTTAGTVLDSFEGSNIFRLTEIVDNETGTGFISIAILNLGSPISLPPNGQAFIARARYRVKPGIEIDRLTDVLFRDGLRGSGVPIENQVNYVGGAERPKTTGLFLRVGSPSFVRGDSNGDRRINLSDVIFIINFLFRAGDPIRCADAGDVNDDGGINLTDPIFFLDYLFRSGPKPPPPHPSLEEDPTDDSLDCQEYP